MNNKYPSFVNKNALKPDYNCSKLKINNYKLEARCNKNNPDCQKFIKDKRNNSFEIKIIELNSSVNKDNKNMIDIWIKKI